MIVDKPPSDYDIVWAIYNTYYEDYVSFDASKRNTRNYVPISLDAIGKQFDCSPYLIFAVLYDSLQGRYGVSGNEDQASKPLFMVCWPEDIKATLHPKFRDERHLVNFAMLAGIFATLRAKRREWNWQTSLSVIAIIVSAIALMKP